MAERIEKAGHKVWLDKSTIQGGARWQEEIVRGIEKADVFVLMLSPGATESENVEREIGLAYTTGKPILPVMLHRTAVPAGLQYAISGLDIIDISEESVETAGERVLTTLALPGARTRGAFGKLGASRAQKFICGGLYVANLALVTREDLGGLLGSALMGALVALLCWWWLGVGRIFWWLLRGLFSRRLTRRGAVILTRLRGFRGSYPQWIVSEWTDPKAGKRYYFHSSPVWWNAKPFVPNEIRVIADPKNFRIYRMDLSFLPKEAGGILKPYLGEARGAGSPFARKQRGAGESGHIFLSYSDSDSQAVAVLVQSLEAAGQAVSAGVGLYREESASQERVIREIGHGRLFLLVLSESSVKEDRIHRELDLAMAYRKPIMAALLHKANLPFDMNYALAGARRVDLSQDLRSGVGRLIEAIGTGPSPATVAYKLKRLASVRKLLKAVGECLKVLLMGFIVVGALAGVWLGRLLPASYRSSLSRFWGKVRLRFGIWTEKDLRTRGTVLLTDYKCLEFTSDNRPRIVSQWYDPISGDVYLFRSATLSVNPSELIGAKTITVYVNPKNMGRYCMDLSFLPATETKGVAFERSTAAAGTGNEIFVSYSKQDADKAGLLIQQLKRKGSEVIDLYEVEVEEGRTSSDAVREAIQGAQIFLIVVPSADVSDLAEKTEELRAAYSCNRRIVPVTFSGFKIPLSMQYTLAGFQCIEVGEDFDAAADRLLKTLEHVGRVENHSDSLAQSEPYPCRTRLTGACIGALCSGFGSILPVFLLHGKPRICAGLAGGALSGLLCGTALGAFCKPRMGTAALTPLGIASVLIGGFVYLPSYHFFGEILSAGDMNGPALLADLVGYLAWVTGKAIEDRFLINRLKRKGKLLLTEYKRIEGGRIVSEWRDPKTDEVHSFCSEPSGRDPSTLVRTTTVAVFVNPTNLKEYYMDLSFHATEAKPSSTQ